jgi:hypothetical protein
MNRTRSCGRWLRPSHQRSNRYMYTFGANIPSNLNLQLSNEELYKSRQQQVRYASMMIITKFRQFNDTGCSDMSFLCKVLKSDYDPWAPPKDVLIKRQSGGGGGFGRDESGDYGRRSSSNSNSSIGFRRSPDDGYSPAGTRTTGGVSTFGSSYSRHPDDSTDDDIDVTEVEKLLEERNEAKRDRDFALADSIRDDLKKHHGVYVDDKERTWSTNVANSGRLGVRNTSTEDFGPTGHDFELCDQAGPSISALSKESIHKLISERLHCKLSRDFDRADEIKKQLNDANVQLDDRAKLWRADGRRFLTLENHDYSYAPDAGPIDSTMSKDEINNLIRERLMCKINREFEAADSIKADLEDAGVFVDDANKLWRADGQSFYSGGRRDDDEYDDNGGGGTTIFMEHTI